jgi:hypothetical protein
LPHVTSEVFAPDVPLPLRPPDPQKGTAATGRGALGGGGEGEAATKPLRLGQCLEGRPGSSLKLIPDYNDDGHVCGWISLGEAVAMAFAKLVESAR